MAIKKITPLSIGTQGGGQQAGPLPLPGGGGGGAKLTLVASTNAAVKIVLMCFFILQKLTILSIG